MFNVGPTQPIYRLFLEISRELMTVAVGHNFDSRSSLVHEVRASMVSCGESKSSIHLRNVCPQRSGIGVKVCFLFAAVFAPRFFRRDM